MRRSAELVVAWVAEARQEGAKLALSAAGFAHHPDENEPFWVATMASEGEWVHADIGDAALSGLCAQLEALGCLYRVRTGSVPAQPAMVWVGGAGMELVRCEAIEGTPEVALRATHVREVISRCTNRADLVTELNRLMAIEQMERFESIEPWRPWHQRGAA
jgi:hypothetical protein